MKRNLILIFVVVALALAQQPVLTKVGSVIKIDQTTPGTTNGVQVNAALPAGSNVIGHVIADSGSTTAVTQPTAGNLNATVVGTGTFAAQITALAAADPCVGTLKVLASISQTTNTRIITGTSAKKIYICAINIGPNADAENISLVEGTGSTCGTSTIAVPGTPAAAAANGWQMAANGGLTYGSGMGTIAATSVNADDVCLLQSGSGRIAGGISYVVQ